jgi:NAD(P)H-dependent FMN reductase
MLSAIKNFIMTHSVVSMTELLTRFEIDEHNMRRILQNWVKKGWLTSSGAVEPCCVKRKNCKACSLLALEYYSSSLSSARSDGDTFRAASALSEGKIPIVNLKDLNISHYDYNHANATDDYFPLMEQVVTHNPIILATPVYWYTMSAIMKTFIDRLSDLLNSRKDLGRALTGKSLFILTSYGTVLPEGFEEPFRQICDYMKMQYRGCYYHHARADVVIAMEQFRKNILNHITKS